jgi:hypothetical protein
VIGAPAATVAGPLIVAVGVPCTVTATVAGALRFPASSVTISWKVRTDPGLGCAPVRFTATDESVVVAGVPPTLKFTEVNANATIDRPAVSPIINRTTNERTINNGRIFMCTAFKDRQKRNQRKAR